MPWNFNLKYIFILKLIDLSLDQTNLQFIIRNISIFLFLYVKTPSCAWIKLKYTTNEWVHISNKKMPVISHLANTVWSSEKKVSLNFSRCLDLRPLKAHVYSVYKQHLSKRIETPLQCCNILRENRDAYLKNELLGKKLSRETKRFVSKTTA